MKAVAVILVLAVISGCHARAIQHDQPQTKWEQNVELFWQYVADLNLHADGVVENIKTSQLRRELDTLITDTMAELTIYKDQIQSQVAPFAKDTSTKLGEDMRLLFDKLHGDMTDAKRRSTEYANELKTTVEQNLQAVKDRVNAYTRKLKKRLGQDTEAIRDTVTTYLGEFQARASQSMENVKEQVQPYVSEARVKASARLDTLTELVKSQKEEFESQATAIRERLEQTAQDLRNTLESQLEELTNWFTPYAAKIREQLKTVSDKIQASS